VQKRQQDKPFDALAERVVSKDSRGDWTPLELFLAGIRALTLQLSIGDTDGALSSLSRAKSSY
jgi:hypothetical protein